MLINRIMDISNIKNRKKYIPKTPFPSLEKDSDLNQVGTPDYNTILVDIQYTPL